MPKGIRTIDPLCVLRARKVIAHANLALWIDHKDNCTGKDGRSPCSCDLLTTLDAGVEDPTGYLDAIAPWVAHVEGCRSEQAESCTCGLTVLFPTF